MRPRKFRISRYLSPDFGVDLGTSHTVISVPGEGIVLDEPTVVAVRRGTREVLGRGDTVGQLASVMHGRTPDSVQTIRPVRRGVVADTELCHSILKSLLHKARPRAWGLKPRLLVAMPGDLTPVERQALVATAVRAGAGQVFLIAKSQAAALGASLPLGQPVASMICDIGAGTAEFAVLCLGEVAVSETLRVAGDDMTRAVINFLRRRHKLHVGDQMAERIKIEIGTAVSVEENPSLEVSGRDATTGMPRKMLVDAEQMHEALYDPVRMLVEAVERILDRCPAELSADLMESGLVLAGGGAQLHGLDTRLTDATGMPVRRVEEPTTCVARGLAVCLENLGIWQGLIQGRAAA